MPKSESISEFGAGASIGALLGLIMGLSVSPVVLTVLGALAAGLLALLGVSNRSNPADAASSNGALRVFGFGAFCTLFLVVGIILRTHDTLAPSVADQEHRLSGSALLSKEEIHQILLLKAYGLSKSSGPKSTDGLQTVGDRNIAASSAPYLFTSQAEICQVMRRDQYNSISSYVKSLRDHGGDYASLANAIGNQKPEDQEQIAESMSDLLCK
jgi:hypothetical protein